MKKESNFIFKDDDIAYGEGVFSTDEGSQFLKRFPSDFMNPLYIWVSDWAKNSSADRKTEYAHIRSLVKVLSFPLAVFYSAKKGDLSSLEEAHILASVSMFSAIGVAGEGVDDSNVYEMLKSIHPAFSERLKAYLDEALLPSYLRRIVYWVTFGLIEALGISIADLFTKLILDIKTHR